MFFTRLRLSHLAALGLLIATAGTPALGRDLRIVIPRRSRLTPVQRLNRDGVKEIQHHHYDKAEALFYKAYLYDPSDPFTLNNLGYVSELQGELDNAETFYRLAGEQSCDATIAMSSRKQLRGKPMVVALNDMQDRPMRIDQANVEAVEMLAQDHPFEARSLLEQTLPLDPKNPFTLNNLGVAEESTGNFSAALEYYDEAAQTGSKQPLIVTMNRTWRGKAVSQAAADSARALRWRIQHTDMNLERARVLAFQGVSSANENDWAAADQDFREAFRLDPGSAFSLNNRAYLAEQAGDLETAQYYYAQAMRAADASDHVGLATRVTATGQPLGSVAYGSESAVNGAISYYTQHVRGTPGTVQLIPRNHSNNENNHNNNGNHSNTQPQSH
jgi:Flp pilus assembly protein TadD